MVNLNDLIQQLPLEEKAELLTGGDFWHTRAIERLEIPAIMMSDGPSGLRKQEKEREEGEERNKNKQAKGCGKRCRPFGLVRYGQFLNDAPYP